VAIGPPLVGLGAVIAFQSTSAFAGAAIACVSIVVAALAWVSGIRFSMETEKIVAELVKAGIVELPLVSQIAARRESELEDPAAPGRRWAWLRTGGRSRGHIADTAVSPSTAGADRLDKPPPKL
jgi:hypothetical protein